jgi:DNA polymerase-3 subunit alpha
VAYGFLAYQTAYLKAHYPTHFYAAVMSNEIDNQDKVVRYINKVRSMGIEILPPDVNHSMEGFTPGGKTIRFGLAAIKGIGQSTVQQIIAARQRGGPFRSLFDFAARVDQKALNKRVLESLIKAGAFGSVHSQRSQMFAAIDSAIDYGGRIQKQRASGQFGLFGGDSGWSRDMEPALPSVAEWTVDEVLAGEKETVGFYITGNPLDKFAPELAKYADTTTEKLDRVKPGAQIILGGIVKDLTHKSTKKGDRFATFNLEDQFGSVRVIVWPDVFSKVADVLSSDALVAVKGKAEARENYTTVIAEEVFQLEQLKERQARTMVVRMASGTVSDAQVAQLYELLDRHRGDCDVIFEVDINGSTTAKVRPNPFVRISISADLIGEVERLCGPGGVELV